MARIIEAFKQFFDNNGDPLVDGWLKFLVSGTTGTDKDTYSDINETIPNSNPVQLDGSGRCPNVFGTGSYRVISYTNDPILGTPSVQIQQFDPVGSTDGDGGFPVWDSATAYNIPDIVVADDDMYYRTLTNNNEGNDPTIDAVNWEEVKFEQVYNANKTYSEFDRCIDSSGISYISLVGSNTGNTPASSPAQWGLKIGSPLDSNGNQVRESKGSDLASATGVTLGDDGNTFDVTGTTDIETISTSGVIGTMIRLQFDGSLTLVHSSDLVLPGSNDIVTASGDIAIFEEYASGDWRLVSYQGQPVKNIIQEVNVQYSAVATGSIVMTFNDTKPTIAEGDKYMEATITPRSSTSVLEITAIWNGACSSNSQLTAALFQDSTSDSIAAVSVNNGIVDSARQMVLKYRMTSGTTSSTTFSIRVGPNNAGTVTFNGTVGARKHGGVYNSSITIREISS